VGPALAERGWSVLALDLRGHGSSPAGVSDGLPLEVLAADVAETAGPGPVDLLVGHSLGALTALALLAREPAFALRLVLEDPPAAATLDWEQMAADLEADARKARTAPDELAAELAAENPRWTEEDVRGKLADLTECDAAEIAAALRAGLDYDLPAMLAAVRVPTLLVLGTEEAGSALAGAERAAVVAALGNGRPVVLPAGHSVHRDAFDAYLRALDDWLAATP
jgi:pimeloyl-ACP methyl ester carboxylesterase